ncbi:MAG: HAD-IC family P-type ATPase [Candidatus Gastranaerophilales bacterium]|nr:HAD-IC family P-type ATPase [Candidatus Gastranaerophilales bacterium]
MFYKKSVEETFKELNTSYCGLSNDEVQQRLGIYGRNSIKEEKPEPLWRLLFKQFKSPLSQILIIASVFSVLIKNYIDAGVILMVLVIDSSVGLLQEYKAQKAIMAIKMLTAPLADVIRNNKEHRINLEEIVPGDIIVLLPGNKIPADIRLFEVKELEIDESTLTGESTVVEKATKIINIDYLPIADQRNMAFMGTVVNNGKGKGVVIGTGVNTELGKIAQDVKSTSKLETPLQKELVKLGKKSGIIAFIFALLAFLVGILRGFPFSQMTMFAISMAVAIIPVGLPVVVTVTLAVGIKLMAEKNAIIRELLAVETLGSCNYICSDKTGTITENMMTVVKAYAGNNEYIFTGTGYNPEGEVICKDKQINNNDNDFELLLLTGLLCNSSDLYKENGKWLINGDSTEGSLIVAAKKYGIDKEKVECQYKMIDEIPFSSTRQYMAALYKHNDDFIIFVKGAPEKILEFTGNSENIQLLTRYSQMAEEGHRVLGFGIKKINSNNLSNLDLENDVTKGLTFTGFMGIIDPPKRSAVEAIQSAQKANIKVVMITGDHAITAVSIAKDVGIYKPGDKFMTGNKLDTCGDEFLFDCIEEVSVYARVSPHHKYKIVSALQNRGNIVAVTGDGINDAPALKKANIGIAMGKTGTDVAKEAADMILKDDNFASIYEAVKVGRIIYDNIQKVVYFLLSSTIGMSFVIIISLLINLPLPFLATQVLWVNLVTNGLQDMALAYEPGEKDIETRSPRNTRESILNLSVIRRLVLVGIVYATVTLFFFEREYSHGAGLDYARTVALNIVVFLQFFNVWNARSLKKSIFRISPFSNPFLLISLIAATIAQILVITLPSFQFVFHTANLSLFSWIQTILASFIIVIVLEIDKYLISSFKY